MFKGRYRFLTLSLIAVLSLALLAACDDNGTDDTPELPEPTAPGNGNGNGNGEPPTGDFTVTMVDIDYDVESLTIPANEEVEIALVNEGVLEHDFTIDEIPVDYEGTGPVETGGDWDLHASLGPGESGSITVTVSEPGEYTFYCSVVGHREAGMEGTLIVE